MATTNVYDGVNLSCLTDDELIVLLKDTHYDNPIVNELICRLENALRSIDDLKYEFGEC